MKIVKILGIIIGTIVVLGVIGLIIGDGEDDTEVVTERPTATEPEATAPVDDEPVDDDDGPLTMSRNQEHAPADDVTLTDCYQADYGWRAALEITNHSPKASNYIVDVQFTDGDGVVVDNGMAAINGLRPGQTAREEAVALVDDDGISCEINRVDRFSAEG